MSREASSLSFLVSPMSIEFQPVNERGSPSVPPLSRARKLPLVERNPPKFPFERRKAERAFAERRERKPPNQRGLLLVSQTQTYADDDENGALLHTHTLQTSISGGCHIVCVATVCTTFFFLSSNGSPAAPIISRRKNRAWRWRLAATSETAAMAATPTLSLSLSAGVMRVKVSPCVRVLSSKKKRATQRKATDGPKL